MTSFSAGHADPLSPSGVTDALASTGYLADDDVAVAVHLALRLDLPLLVEGEPGVGKTELAKALAQVREARLIRIQCHEGIDVHQALYDWDYQRQLLMLRASDAPADETAVYHPRFLIRRPLLEALEHDGPVVLLIDEIDRADEAFEAFLLEVLGEFQVTIPELGTITAVQRPTVVLTSNRTRELHDALKRRCLYVWIDTPDEEREAAIVRARLPGVPEELALRVARAAARLRELELYKPPGIGETIVWAQAVMATGDLERTVGAAVKVREDLIRVRESGALREA